MSRHIQALTNEPSVWKDIYARSPLLYEGTPPFSKSARDLESELRHATQVRSAWTSPTGPPCSLFHRLARLPANCHSQTETSGIISGQFMVAVCLADSTQCVLQCYDLDSRKLCTTKPLVGGIALGRWIRLYPSSRWTEEAFLVCLHGTSMYVHLSWFILEPVSEGFFCRTGFKLSLPPSIPSFKKNGKSYVHSVWNGAEHYRLIVCFYLA